MQSNVEESGSVPALKIFAPAGVEKSMMSPLESAGASANLVVGTCGGRSACCCPGTAVCSDWPGRRGLGGIAWEE